jgi:lysozyme family protein
MYTMSIGDVQNPRNEEKGYGPVPLTALPSPYTVGKLPSLRSIGQPWSGGEFHCTGGSCIPADGRALATVQQINRQLGITREARDGIDFLTLQYLNGQIVGGQLLMRPLHSPQEAAMYAFDLLKALIRRPGFVPSNVGPLGRAHDSTLSMEHRIVAAEQAERRADEMARMSTARQGIEASRMYHAQAMAPTLPMADRREALRQTMLLAAQAYRDAMREDDEAQRMAAMRMQEAMDLYHNFLDQGGCPCPMPTAQAQAPLLGRAALGYPFNLGAGPAGPAVPASVAAIAKAQTKAKGTPQAKPATKKVTKILATDAAKVKKLQQAINYSLSPTGDVKTIKEDGILGPETIATLNALQGKYGKKPLSAKQIRLDLDEIIKAIAEKGITPAATTVRPAASPRAKDNVASVIQKNPKILKIPPGTKAVNDFGCNETVCYPGTNEAKTKAVALQKLLNRLPAPVRAQYPNAKPLSEDGKIGPGTAEAVRVVLRESSKRQRKLPSAEIANVTHEAIASNIDSFFNSVAQEKPLLEEAYAVPPGSHFRILANGNAVGDPWFTCMAMALQAQLNRMGQNLRIDGTIGRNTADSFNVLAQKTEQGANKLFTIPAIAREIESSVLLARDIADRAGAPPPPRSTLLTAVKKCGLESKKPVADARFWGGVLVRAPIPAPTPTPTPAPAQPAPVITEKAKALQNLLNEFPAPMISHYYIGGKPLDVNGVIDEPTAYAVRSVLYAANDRLGQPRETIIATITPQVISADIDTALQKISSELPLERQRYAAAPAPPPVPAPTSEAEVVAPPAPGPAPIETAPTTRRAGRRAPRGGGAPTYVPSPPMPEAPGGEEAPLGPPPAAAPAPAPTPAPQEPQECPEGTDYDEKTDTCIPIAAAPGGAPSPGAPVTPAPVEEKKPLIPWWGWAIGGVALVGTGVGIAVAVRPKKRKRAQA